MALVLLDRVQQTGTANTTVSFTLTGTVTGFQSFTVVGNGNTTYYSATDATGNWEVGLGTYSTTGPTLTRTTILSSSNAGAAVTFSGSVNVFVTYPAGKSVNLDASGNATGLGTPAAFTATNVTGLPLTTGVTGTLGLGNGGTGQTTAQAAINSFAGAVTSGSYLRGNGTNVVMSTIQAGDVPTLNQNTTGTAANITATSNSTLTTLSALSLPGSQVSGNISGNAANVTGTVAVANGGTGLTTAPTNGQIDIGSTGVGFVRTTISAGTGISVTNAAGSITITNTSPSSGGTVTSVTGTSPVASSGGNTPAISLSSGYGDTQNPYVSKTANFFLAAPNGLAGVPTFRAIVAADIPTLNQNTTGTASNVTGTVALGNGGSGQTTAQAAMNTFAGAVTSGSYLRGNGTNVVMSAIQAGDVPTLNQNTTGSAGSVANAVTFNNAGTGAASGTTYNGSGAVTISYNTIGAQVAGSYSPLAGSSSLTTTGTVTSGTWSASFGAVSGANLTNLTGANVTGTVANATNATNASNLTGGNITGNMIVGNATSPNTYYLQFGDNTGWVYRFMTSVSGTPTTRFSFVDNGSFTAVGSITGSSFSGAGTGLTGTASSLSIGGNAATATSATSATSAGSVTNSVTFNNGGAGAVSGTTYNGSAAQTISYNTVGASPLAGSSSLTTTGTVTSGTWSASFGAVSGANLTNLTGANVTGTVASATSATSATNATNVGNTTTTSASTFYPAFMGANTTSNQGTNTNASLTYVPSTGVLTAVSHVSSSDERLKENWDALPINFVLELAQVKHGTYDRISNNNREVGVSAQSFKKVLAEAVVRDEFGFLSVNYGNAALVSAIQLAKEIVELRKEIELLKAR